MYGQTFPGSIVTMDARYSCNGQPLPSSTQYVYGSGTDTLHLFDYAKDFRPYTVGFQDGQTTIYDTLRVPSSGETLIVFCRIYAKSESAHGGTFDIEESLTRQDYEIWNLTTGQHLLTVEGGLDHQYSRFEAYVQPSHRRGFIARTYEFEIDSSGNVTTTLIAYTHRVESSDRTNDTLFELPISPAPAIGSKVTYRLVGGHYLRE